MEMLMSMDQACLFWIQGHLVSPLLSPIMIMFSSLGNAGIIWILIGMAMLYNKKYRTAGIAVFIGLSFSLLVGNIILKPLVMRLRPCLNYPWVPLLVSCPPINDFSFPSGHTFGSFAALAAMFNVLQDKEKWLLSGLAVLIGFSRMYLFLHYPSDVFFGCIFGIIFGRLAWRIAETLPVREGKYINN